MKATIGFIVQGDQEAAARLVADREILGLCMWTRAGASVYVTDRKVFSGYIQFREKCDPQRYWTVREAVY